MAEEVVPERMLTCREVAQVLGLAVNTVKDIPATALPFYRVTSRGDRRYYPSDVERYLRHTTEGYRHHGRR